MRKYEYLYDKSTFKNMSTRIPKHRYEKYEIGEMGICIIKHKEELQTVDHSNQNPQYQQNSLSLNPNRIFNINIKTQKKYIQIPI